MKTILAILGAMLLFAAFMHVYQYKPQSQLRFTQDVIDSFEDWQASYGENYADVDEEVYRMEVFNNNYQQIQWHNDHSNDYTMAQNQFMCLTQEEFAAQYLTLLQPKAKTPIQEIMDWNVPSNDVNWVQAGAVTPVKNQGQCGSCWAFSTTGCLEGVSKIFAGNLQSFSEQQLVDCSSSYGNQGCNGGLMDYAFEYVIAHGIVTEAQYPYTGRQGTCKINSGPFKIKSYTDVPAGNCNALVTALNKQPISVAVDAQTWQFYSTGIFSNCGTSLDHGVLAVGYVSNSYWLIKNSWGTSWGEQGYIQLKWGNTCGLCNEASYANY